MEKSRSQSKHKTSTYWILVEPVETNLSWAEQNRATFSFDRESRKILIKRQVEDLDLTFYTTPFFQFLTYFNGNNDMTRKRMRNIFQFKSFWFSELTRKHETSFLPDLIFLRFPRFQLKCFLLTCSIFRFKVSQEKVSEILFSKIFDPSCRPKQKQTELR